MNKPRWPVMNYQRDSSMSFGQGDDMPNYEPNSYDTAPKEAPEYAEPPFG